MNTQETTEVRYSDEDLTVFKTNIEKKLETANKELEYLNSRIVKDMPEKEQLQFQQLATRQQTFIDHLTAAQERIENGSYGICRVTGKLIDKDRLMAVPHATLSLEAKQSQINQQPAAAEAAQEKKPRKSKQKKEDAGTDRVRYPDEDLRNFKTLIGNKIDETNEEVKFLQVVLADRNRGIKVDGYEDMSPADVEALIASKKSYTNELEQALDRVKKKTFGIDELTLIPKEVLLRIPVIRRMEGTPEQASTVITHTPEENPVRKCRVCGCTEDDCSQCIEKTGKPCHWVEEDLCSACVEESAQDEERPIGSQHFYPVGNKPDDLKLLGEYKGYKFYDNGPSNSYQGANLFDICLSQSEQLHAEYYYPNSETSLKETIQRAENWVDDYIAAKEKAARQVNHNGMTFFTQLAGQGNVDLTLRIMQKNGKLTMRIDPGIGSALLKPINITGTPEEFDEEFFTLIVPKVQEIKGLVTNLDEVKKAAEQKKEEAAKAPAPKAPAKKAVQKKPAPAKKPGSHKLPPKNTAKKSKSPKEKPIHDVKEKKRNDKLPIVQRAESTQQIITAQPTSEKLEETKQS